RSAAGRTTSRRFLRCVLACALALRALVHHALVVHGAGHVGRSLTLGARILSEVVPRLPRAMHSGPFLEWLSAALVRSCDQERAQRVYRTVSPSRGTAYPSNEPSQPIATLAISGSSPRTASLSASSLAVLVETARRSQRGIGSVSKEVR